MVVQGQQICSAQKSNKESSFLVIFLKLPILNPYMSLKKNYVAKIVDTKIVSINVIGTYTELLEEVVIFEQLQCHISQWRILAQSLHMENVKVPSIQVGLKHRRELLSMID